MDLGQDPVTSGFADATIDETFVGRLGGRIRERRLRAGVGLRCLARDVGVSPSLVSQIELGRTAPSVATLYAIVTRLGISLDELFLVGNAAPAEDEDVPNAYGRWQAPSDGPVLRGANRLRLQWATGVCWERLTASDDRRVDFVRCTYPVGGESAPADAMMVHGGAEYGLVVSGRCGASLADEHYELAPGDSIVFDARTPHRIWNLGEPMVSVWVVVGRDDDPRLAP
jgi:transcriptional regulator with XRE-family HTH domain